MQTLSSRSSWSGGEADINQANNKCKWRSSAQCMMGVGCNPTGNQKGFFGEETLEQDHKKEWVLVGSRSV